MARVTLRSSSIKRLFDGSTSGARNNIQTGSTSNKITKIEERLGRDFQEFRDSAGTLRVRIGRQTDGKYGIRVWNSSGVLSHDQTYM